LTLLFFALTFSRAVVLLMYGGAIIILQGVTNKEVLAAAAPQPQPAAAEPAASGAAKPAAAEPQPAAAEPVSAAAQPDSSALSSRCLLASLVITHAHRRDRGIYLLRSF
jgi:hypothetical protein